MYGGAGQYGLPPDPAKAVDYFRKAASKDLPEAQFNLGWCWLSGEGVEMSPTKALEWFEKAAANGSADAMHNLAVLYQEGEHVTQDDAKSALWQKKCTAARESAGEMPEEMDDTAA
ncbi:hypothetical protein T484DRAFT_2845393 [Baffinella frigidus]|nr:hypothetical protein T484DRAFT_2845393 [Cryptophyta sp. CCMP2293]